MIATRARDNLWLLASIGAALLLCAIIAHAIARVPVPFNDNFSEIANTYRVPLSVIVAREFSEPAAYFRPFELVYRSFISHGLQQGIFGYNFFETIWLGLVLVSFTLVCYPRSARDFTAFLVALAILAGHHAMHGAWEFNIVISNGMVLLAGVVSIALIGRSPTLGGQVAAVALTAISLLTKEVGLVIAWVFLIAHLLRMPGIRRATAVIIVLLTAAYLCFRFYTLPPLSIDDPQRASTLTGYAANALTSIAMFWVGLPLDGEWGNSTRFIAEPWQWIQIGAGIATLLLLMCGWVLASDPEERRTADAPYIDRRWFILFGAALVACAALAFYYPRHRHGAPAVPLLAYCSYLSMQVLLWRLDNLREPLASVRPHVLTVMIIAGLTCALLWPLRVVTGFEFLRMLGARSIANWSNKMPEYWVKGGSDYQPFLLPLAQSVDLVPRPRRDIWILRLLGSHPHKSVNI